MKRGLLIYLTSYLIFGGLGFAFAPELALRLFLSTSEYSEPMVRLVGMFMLALGGLVGTITYHRDYKYYPFSVVARTFITLFIFWIYAQTHDRMFLIINGIVLVGLIPSYVVVFREHLGRRG